MSDTKNRLVIEDKLDTINTTLNTGITTESEKLGAIDTTLTDKLGKLDTINTTLDTKMTTESEKIESINTTLDAKLDKLDDITNILTTINETLKDDSYTKVEPVGTENPSEEGWYEKNSEGKYVLSEDTKVDTTKTYYIKSNDKGVNQIKAEIDDDNNLTITIKKNGAYVDSTEVNIPMSSVLKGAYYDSATNAIVIEFENGDVMRFSLTAMLKGLMPMEVSFTIPASNWIASGADYYADLTDMANTILANVPVYTAVEDPSGSPAGQGWYEKNDDGEYVLSTDTKVDDTKTYFTKSNKSLNGTYKFDLSANMETQGIVDNSNARQVSLVTTKTSGSWQLLAYTKGGNIETIITLPCVMCVVNPSTDDMDVVGTPIYKSNQILNSYDVSALETETYSAKMLNDNSEDWEITYDTGDSETKAMSFLR